MFNESYKTHLIPSPSLFEWRLTSLSPSLSPFSSPILKVWKWRKNYIGKGFLQYESFSDNINFLSQRMPCYINYIWISDLNYDFLVIWLIIFSRKLLDVSFTFKCFSPLYVCTCDTINYLSEKIPLKIRYIWSIFLQCESSYD